MTGAMIYARILTCLLFLVVSQGTAQGPQKLEQLLKQLEEVPTEAWTQHIKKIESQIAAHKQRADVLRKQAKQLEKRAEAEDRAGAVLRDQIERLRSLMEIVEPKPHPVSKKMKAKTAAAKKPAGKKPVPKKPAGKKPPARKPPAKKPAPKTAMKPKTTVAINWETHIQPIFETHCMVCHDQDDSKGGLDLSSYASLLQGGGSGHTVVKGQPGSSRLYQLLSHSERPFMPKDADKLPDAQIELIRQWIALGAPENAAAASIASAEMAKKRAARPKTVIRPDFKGPPPMPTKLAKYSLASVNRPAAIKTLAVSPRAPLVAISGEDQVLLYDTKTLRQIGIVPFDLGQVEVVRFTLDGRRMLVAGGRPGKRGGAAIYDVETGKLVTKIGRERDSVLAAAISPGQSIVAIGGSKKVVRVYSVASGEKLYEIKGHRDWILGLDISSDGNYLASADRSGTVIVSEADTGRNVHTLRGHRGAVFEVLFSPDAKLLGTAGQDGTMRAFEMRDGRQVASTRAHASGVLAIAFGKGDIVASSGKDGQVRLWRNGRSLGNLPAAGEWVYAVGFSPDSTRVFAGDWLGRLHVYDVKTRRRTAVLTPSRPAARQ